ncbi:similar to Saccharomyces cerevisiae YPL085W SEC16 COPII vesicle coat protein required for ER transport vesicle budding [Maudiozyma saulgeensis]|uniref:Protein transport protein sec16 n=1 Tax=Maudiozyma saulgeensis TaxID=1789683 RepID=A0A1X7R6I1_9SACH|nr:similar to Saccharomyces cerevisiae YPL085W SEC16 COPII vesicle coat protein required for ER transport vesicle budding [Kazachstania saulgeensis]
MATDAKRKKNQKKKARQKQKKAEQKALQQTTESSSAGTEISESTEEDSTTIPTTDNSVISSIPHAVTTVLDDIVDKTQQEVVPQQQEQQHDDLDSFIEDKDNTIDLEAENKLPKHNSIVESNTIPEMEENQQSVEETESQIPDLSMEQSFTHNTIEMHEPIPEHTANILNTESPSLQTEETEEIKEQPLLSNEVPELVDENAVMNETETKEEMEITQPIDTSITEQIIELPKADVNTQETSLENEFHMEPIDNTNMIEQDVFTNETKQRVHDVESGVPEAKVSNNNELEMNVSNDEVGGYMGLKSETENPILNQIPTEEPMNIDREESLLLEEDSSINKSFENTVVHSELSYDSYSQNETNFQTHGNRTDDSMNMNHHQDEILFSQNNEVEVETMPWEQEKREPIALETQLQDNYQDKETNNTNDFYEQTEQPATIHSELFTKTEDPLNQNIVPESTKTEQETDIQTGNIIQGTSNSNSLFAADNEQDDELLPWEVETDTNPEIVSNPVATSPELQQGDYALPDNSNQDVTITDIPTEIQQANSNPQSTTAVENENNTVDTTKNNFSFMDDDEDLLEDDDSFLDSDEELPTDLEPKTTVQEDQQFNSNVETSFTTNVSSSLNVSKYAPQGTTSLAQSVEVPMERSGIVQPPPMIFSNTIQQPQIGSQTPSTQLQTSVNSQKTVETINKAKQKSDAYDFPSDLLGSNPKPIHAKAVATPTMRYGSIPSMDMNPPSVRKTSIPYSPLQTSAAPPPPPMTHNKRHSQQHVQISTPTMNQPPVRSRVSSGVGMIQPQAPLTVGIPQPGMPYARQRATSILSNGSGMGIYPPATTYTQPLSPQGGNTVGTPAIPSKKSKYAPASNVQQQVVNQQRSYTQPPTGYVSGQSMLNSNAGMMTQPIFPPNGNTQINAMQQPVLPPTSFMSSPTMANQGPISSNAYSVNQVLQKPNNIPVVKQQYYPPTSQNITSNQQILKTHEAQLNHRSNYAPQVSQTEYPTGLGINAQSQVPMQQALFQSNTVQTSAVDHQSLLTRQFPLFCWGKSNKIVYGIPEANSMYSGTGFSLNTINIVNYDSILITSDVMKTYIGPLSPKTKKVELEKWLDSMLNNMPEDFNDTTSLIWNILKGYVNGTADLESIANMLCDTTSTRMYVTQPFTLPKPVANASRLEPNTQNRVLALLQIGNYEDALNIALEGQDFTMALLVGSLAGKETWSSVVDSYLRMGSPTYSDHGINVLSLLFQVFIGNSKIAIANIYNNQEHITWAIQNWRYIVSVILANAKSVTGSTTLKVGQLPPMILEFLVEFAIFLYKQGLNLEADILFVIARIPLSFSPVITGSDVYFKYIGQPSTTESLIWSEIYEYTRSITEPTFKGFPTLLSQKMNYGFALEQQNLSSQAAKYNENVATKIKSLPRKDAYAANLMNSSNILTARINNSSTGWLGKPKLSSVWGQLDKSFNKYIGGDVDKKPTQTPEKDVFGTYTPYTSNHSSVVDLDQTNLNQYQPQGNYRPLGQVAHHSTTPGNVLSMEHLKKASHHTFGEQNHYETPLRIGESLQGSPGRTYTTEVGRHVPTPHNPLPRVQSEIFETNKVAPPPIIRGDTSNLVLQRSVTHDHLNMEVTEPMTTLANDIANIGPPQPLNRQAVTSGPLSGPPRRSSNVSVHSEVPPPPKGRLNKGKSSHRQPNNNAISIDQLTSLQTTPSSNTLTGNVPPISAVSQSAMKRTPESDITSKTSITMEHSMRNELTDHVTNLPVEINSFNDLIKEDTQLEKTDSSNKLNLKENEKEVNDQDVITEENTKNNPSQHDINVLDHINEDTQNDELESPNLSEPPLEQGLPRENEEKIVRNATDLKTIDDSISDGNVTEKSDDISYSRVNVHERTEFSEDDNLKTKIGVTAIHSNDQEIESPEKDTLQQMDHTVLDSNEEKIHQSLEFAPEEITETAEVPPAILQTTKNEMNDGILAIDPTNITPQNEQEETEEIPPVEKTEEIMDNSKPPNIIAENKVSIAKKHNAYAPNNAKTKPKVKNNPYLPKNATSNQNLNTEQFPELSGETNMFTYNNYVPSPYSNSENEKIAEDSSDRSNMNSESQESNNFQPYMQPLSPDMMGSPVNNSNAPRKSFSNDKFGPIKEADEVSMETFEPVIKKNTGNNFNTFTAEVTNTEYNDVIEDESESEDEHNGKPNNEIKKNSVKKNNVNDLTGDNQSIWRRWLGKDPGEKKAVKAKLGNENSFYYDNELKRWVDRNATEEQKKEMAEASKPGPPPPIIKRKDLGPTSSPRASANHNIAPPSAFSPVVPMDPLTGKPLTRPSSSSDKIETASPTADSTSRFSTNPNIESLVGKKANDLDDLLKVSASVNRGGKRKKKANRGYVNAM